MADDAEGLGIFQAFFEDPNVRFPQQPRLVPDLGIYEMPDGLGFQFRGGPVPTVLRGRKAVQAITFLLPLLDGTRRLADILEQRPPDLSRHILLRALYLLHTKGLVCNGELQDSLAPPSGAAVDESLQRQLLFWGRKVGVTGYANSGQDVQGKLESANILIICSGLFGAITADLLTRTGCSRLKIIAWDDSGLVVTSLANSRATHDVVELPRVSVDEAIACVRDFIDSVDLIVTATRNAPAELFRSLNRLCLDHRRPLLCADEDGSQLTVGPYLQPYSSACYTCMELRRASAAEYVLEDHLYQQYLARDRVAGESIPQGEALPFATLCASLLISEAVRIVSGVTPPTLVNAQLTLPLLSGELQLNRILRVPCCPDCRGGGRTSDQSH
jgi:bacteriocin biosynthesis cyclodehydratase domain-containing protein